jgi:hypothetical protein
VPAGTSTATPVPLPRRARPFDAVADRDAGAPAGNTGLPADALDHGKGIPPQPG